MRPAVTAIGQDHELSARNQMGKHCRMGWCDKLFVRSVSHDSQRLYSSKFGGSGAGFPSHRAVERSAQILETFGIGG